MQQKYPDLFCPWPFDVKEGFRYELNPSPSINEREKRRRACLLFFPSSCLLNLAVLRRLMLSLISSCDIDEKEDTN